MLLFLEKLPGHSIFSEHRGEYFPRRHDFPSPSLAESAGEFFILRQNVWESACGGFWYSRYIAHCPPAGSGGFHHNAAVSSPARETKGEKWRETTQASSSSLGKKGFREGFDNKFGFENLKIRSIQKRASADQKTFVSQGDKIRHATEWRFSCRQKKNVWEGVRGAGNPPLLFFF